MKRGAESTVLKIVLILAIFLFYCPRLLISQNTQNGNLYGFVFDEDETTPLEGVVVIVKNIATSKIYQSEKTNRFGVFKIEGLEPGIYIFGVTTPGGNFECNKLIAVERNGNAKLSMALCPTKEEEIISDVKEAAPPSKAPSTAGPAQSGPARETPLGLPFIDPAGVATIIAGSSAAALGAVNLGEQEFVISRFK